MQNDVEFGNALQIIELKKDENSNNKFILKEDILKTILEQVGQREIAIYSIAGNKLLHAFHDS
jgi:hypothetical protein